MSTPAATVAEDRTRCRRCKSSFHRPRWGRDYACPQCGAVLPAPRPRPAEATAVRRPIWIVPLSAVVALTIVLGGMVLRSRRDQRVAPPRRAAVAPPPVTLRGDLRSVILTRIEFFARHVEADPERAAFHYHLAGGHLMLALLDKDSNPEEAAQHLALARAAERARAEAEAVDLSHTPSLADLIEAFPDLRWSHPPPPERVPVPPDGYPGADSGVSSAPAGGLAVLTDRVRLQAVAAARNPGSAVHWHQLAESARSLMAEQAQQDASGNTLRAAYDEAEAAYRKALSLSKLPIDRAAIWHGLFLLAENQRRPEEQMQAAEAAVEAMPCSARLWAHYISSAQRMPDSTEKQRYGHVQMARWNVPGLALKDSAPPQVAPPGPYGAPSGFGAVISQPPPDYRPWGAVYVR